MFTGGEPLVRKADIIKLCEKHNDCAFLAYTNGTLVDEAFCNEMLRVGNLYLAISLEGFEAVNDLRRGDGVYGKVMHAMDLLKENGLIFGTSICYTSKNIETVTSDEFVDLMVDKGCRYAFYFHYMPVGNDAAVDLLPTVEQRTYMRTRVREIRKLTTGKGLFTMDFQNDGEFVGGCIAGGRNYFHINANGDVEPCVFIHYSNANIYKNRVFDSKGVADPSVEIQFGPNIKDWPQMPALAENLILKVVSEIHDPVTTTDELIPSGETSSFRSNPLGLAEFTLSRKDPAYVGRAKEVQVAEKAIQNGECPAEALPELKPVFGTIHTKYPQVDKTNVGVGSTIFAVKPGDGSAREQAASCQRVLGGMANIAREYATKRYRSNLINWGMLPFVFDGDLVFDKDDYIFVKDIKKAIETKEDTIHAYVVNQGMKEIELHLGNLTDDEREIILKGCLINYNKKN